MTATSPPFVLAFGDSLTAGYGLAPRDAFPAQLERALQPAHPGARVQNAGVSGDTTASALARLPRLLSALHRRPDLAIVELGANDLLRGMPLATTRANLHAILTLFGECGIPVLLAAMEAPRFLGRYAALCDTLYRDAAERYGATLAPFFPPGVMGQRAWTLADGLHPNAGAIARVATHLLPVVSDALYRSAAATTVSSEA